SAEIDNTAEEYEQQLQQRKSEEMEAIEGQLAQHREEEETRQRREQEVLKEAKDFSLQDQVRVAVTEALNEHSSVTPGVSTVALFLFENCTEDEVLLLEGEIIHNVRDLGGGW
ncbi:hypothetical protein BGZ80_002601, partial [Entomortierella chlamydospora]